MQRALFSSLNPALGWLPGIAERARNERSPAAAGNPFVELEKVNAALIEQSMDLFRDLRDTAYENLFYAIWGTPYMRWFGRTKQPGRTLKRKDELRSLPPVQAALMHIEEGGFCEAVIRMLILLADSRGNVRRDRLERSARVLTQDEPFKSLNADERSFILQEQTLIVEFAPELAIETLPKLLKTPEERELAAKVVRFIPGAIDEMTPHTLETLQQFHKVLGLPPVSGDITEDPLAATDVVVEPGKEDARAAQEEAASKAPAKTAPTRTAPVRAASAAAVPSKSSPRKTATRKAAARKTTAPRKSRSRAKKPQEPAE